MYKVAAYPHSRPIMPESWNSWPPTARKIHKQGRSGNKPRPVTCVRITPPKASRRNLAV